MKARSREVNGTRAIAREPGRFGESPPPCHQDRFRGIIHLLRVPRRRTAVASLTRRQQGLCTAASTAAPIPGIIRARCPRGPLRPGCLVPRFRPRRHGNANHVAWHAASESRDAPLCLRRMSPSWAPRRRLAAVADPYRSTTSVAPPAGLREQGAASAASRCTQRCSTTRSVVPSAPSTPQRHGQRARPRERWGRYSPPDTNT